MGLGEDDTATPLNELEITQESHYSPFGMNHLGPWYETVAPENKYLYNGKELNGDYEIKLMDYGARWYDGAIGRWTAVDPLAEEYYSFSSYNYALGNPIRFIDPTGMAVEETEDKITFTGDHARAAFGILKEHFGQNNGDNNDCDDPPCDEDGKSSQSQFAYGGSFLGVYGGTLRMWYMAESYSYKYKFSLNGSYLYESGIAARTNLKHKVRGLTIEPWRSLLNKHYPITTPPPGATPRFWRTNLGWNLGGAGSIGLGIIGAGLSVNNIANSDTPVKQVVYEGFSFAGAWAGMKAFAPFAMRARNPYIGGGLLVAGSIAGSIGANSLIKKIENYNERSRWLTLPSFVQF